MSTISYLENLLILKEDFSQYLKVRQSSINYVTIWVSYYNFCIPRFETITIEPDPCAPISTSIRWRHWINSEAAES